MDFDPYGRKIANIEAEHAHKQNGPVICCQEMFIIWLDTPDATWGNLIELLIDSEQQELAKQVKDGLGLQRMQTILVASLVTVIGVKPYDYCLFVY